MRLNAQDERLQGKQIQDFRDALLDAFFSKATFRDFLLFQLNKRIEHITDGKNLSIDITSVIERADEEAWGSRIIQAARIWRPYNLALLVFSQQFGLAPTFASLNVFESKVRPYLIDLDVVQWRTRLSELEAQICYIEIAGSRANESGTGFLVGPDMVMTCFHVMEKVIRQEIARENVTLRFDYKALADGRTINAGTEYHLTTHNWNINHSEYSSLDYLPHIGNAIPSPDELDYVLLKIDGEPGNSHPFGNDNKDTQAQKRGWIHIPPQPILPTPNMALLILHHPDGERLKFTIDTNVVLNVNANQTRVRYQTNTAHGSSGAPCFTLDWQLVALHHTGDPSTTSTHHQANFNQGIPFLAIQDRLKRQKIKIKQVTQKTFNTNLESQTLFNRFPKETIEIPSVSATPNVQKKKLPISTHTFAEQQNTKLNPSKKQENEDVQEINELPINITPLPMARGYIEQAQHYLDEAIVPFNNRQQTVIRAQFKEAITALESLHLHIKNLDTLLNEIGTFSPQTRVSIDLQADIVKNCIDGALLPHLRRNIQVNFSSLQNALGKLSQLLSDEQLKE